MPNIYLCVLRTSNSLSPPAKSSQIPAPGFRRPDSPHPTLFPIIPPPFNTPATQHTLLTGLTWLRVLDVDDLDLGQVQDQVTGHIRLVLALPNGDLGSVA